jgi:N-acetylneuraminic acid mutarotase
VEGALIGEKIYVPGGRLADGSPTDVLEIYDPRQDIWEKGTSLPKKISNYAMADFEGKLYIFGGWDGEKPLTDVYVYDPEEDVWGARTPMAIARRDSIAVLVQSKILLLGGKNLKEDFFVHEIYYPDRDGTQEIPWEEIANNFLDTPFCVQSLGEILISFSKSDRSEASVSYFLSQENQWVSGEIIEEFYVKDGIASTSLQGNVYFLGGKDENMSITSFFAKYKGTYIVTFPNLAQ